jgi:hypothetical protein
MKIYVAGPMRGYDRFNFPAFDEAAQSLRTAGHEVRSPAEHDRASGFDETKSDLDGFDLSAAFTWDIESVLCAEVVALLPGWRGSTGAGIEKTVAEACGKRVMEYRPGGGLVPLSDSPSLEAHDIVNGARRASYGHPADQYRIVAALWGTILGVEIADPATVGLCMVAFKISREMNRHSRDNLVDIAGYAETLQHVHRGEEVA